MTRMRGRLALIASGALFLLFLADVVGGRLLAASGGSTGVPDIVQFLIFFASVICFVAAVLQKEGAARATRDGVVRSSTG